MNLQNWDKLNFFQNDKFRKIIQFIKKEDSNGKSILPLRKNLLQAFVLTPLEQVKVVILGQDPYPTAKPVIHAHGLAFSVNPEVNPLPKSLVNIFKELKNDTGIKKENGDLSVWAKQGVLLLNTSLSVEAGKPGSHKNLGWSELTNEVIQTLNNLHTNVVFILWGAHAGKYRKFIDQDKHHVIQSAHPSPLSAHRGFFGSKPFSKTNKYLSEHNIKPINW